MPALSIVRDQANGSARRSTNGSAKKCLLPGVPRRPHWKWTPGGLSETARTPLSRRTGERIISGGILCFRAVNKAAGQNNHERRMQRIHRVAACSFFALSVSPDTICQARWTMKPASSISSEACEASIPQVRGRGAWPRGRGYCRIRGPEAEGLAEAWPNSGGGSCGCGTAANRSSLGRAAKATLGRAAKASGQGTRAGDGPAAQP